MYDLIIKNGRIIDGTGSPSYFADVAIKDGKIARIAKEIEGGDQIIDARGLVVTPGFIDSHSHSDSLLLKYPDQIEKIEQGITTSIAGQCGTSPAPVSMEIDPATAEHIGDFGKSTDIYRTMGTFLNIAKDVPLGANMATFVGHSALRKAVMGCGDRAPSKEELERMKELLREGIEHGALGVSFGLIYTPSCYAKTDELIELAKVAREYNALVAAHIRQEGDFLIKSTEEFLTVIKTAGVRGILSHHKASGKENWGKVTHTLRMLEEANNEGYEVYCDVYPYNASHTSLSATFIPREMRATTNDGLAKLLADPQARTRIREFGMAKWGHDISWVQITQCQAYPQYEGKLVSEIAKIHGKEVYETICDMIADSKNICNACYFTMCEEDIKTVLAYPRAMICTDSGVAGASKVYHPRLRGTFPRVLGKYVHQCQVTSLPEMIRKMTSMPATVYGLKGKGLLVEGFDADLCIFDPNRIIDRAEYTDCSKRAEGLNYVLLGGQVVVENAVYNGKRPGRVLLRNK